MKTVLATTILGGVLAATALPAHALPAHALPASHGAERQATGWLAWLGCWEAIDGDTPAGSLVCILPGERTTDVRMITYRDGERTAETVVHADGVSRPIEEGGCVGQQTARWSADGRRVFVRSAFECGGLGRVSTGVIAMTGADEWVDAQALTVAGQHAARSIRYRAVAAADVPAEIAAQLPADRQLAQETARLELAQPLSVEAVVEATRHIAPPAVEALLAAGGHGFDVDAALLQRLAREQVPTSIIDMMVALSYPERFAIRDRAWVEDAARTPSAYSRDATADVCYDTFFMRPVYGAECSSYRGYGVHSRYGRYGYGRYGYGSRLGYSPWGYDPYGWYHGREPVIVIVEPGRDRDRDRGEVVKGRGYVNPNRSGTRTGAQPRADDGGSRPAQPAASNNRGRRSDDSSATSGSSSGSSTGRTAVPRRRGGGGNEDPNG